MTNTFGARIIEEVFRTCFFLVFANTSEILETIDEKRRQYKLEKKPILESIRRIEALITKNEKSKNRLLDGIEHGTFTLSEVDDRLSRIRADITSLQNQKEAWQKELGNFELEIESLAEDFKEERLLQFLSSPSSGKRAIYLDMIESAFVYLDHLYIRFKNGKSFTITLHEHQGKLVQSTFNIKVIFKKRFQYSIVLDTTKHNFELLDTQSYRAPVDTSRQRAFRQSIYLHYAELLNQLRLRINDLLSQVEVNLRIPDYDVHSVAQRRA